LEKEEEKKSKGKGEVKVLLYNFSRAVAACDRLVRCSVSVVSCSC